MKSYTFENVRRTHTIEVAFMKAGGNSQTGVFVDGDGPASFKLSDKNYPPESTLVYHLGVEYMDNMWLIISISDGIVAEYLIDVT